MTRFLIATILFVSSPAFADEAPAADATALPGKVSFLLTFGEEKCPEVEDPDEIVVCAAAPEGDRYRIPKELREQEKDEAADQSWTSAVESLDDTARPMRPNSCSVVGSGGFTGCTQAMLREWFAARRGKSSTNP